MVKPNGLLVTVSSTYYYAYTSVLSTWSSSTALLKGFTPWEISSRGRFRAYMPSALILTKLRYPAVPLA